MRRTIALVAVIVAIPASSAVAADLNEILEKSREASYSADQIITCSTPDGVQDAVVRIAQVAGDLHVGTPVEGEYSVASGAGGWALIQQGNVVSSASVDLAVGEVVTTYSIDDGVPVEFLGRDATLYQMFGEELVRAELITDDEVGALLRVVTYGDDGQVYCERKFIDFDIGVPVVQASEPPQVASLQPFDSSGRWPGQLGSFALLDSYEDGDGVVFGYYSDGFFSFAVFETPSVVQLSLRSEVTFDERTYGRIFTPGQVTYSWETPSGGLALIGDLPPDMHSSILQGLPEPHAAGLFRRLWRSLFG